MKLNPTHCPTCNTKHTFSPSLKERGMTVAQAQSIFIDAKGGYCTECYIKKCDQDVKGLMARQTNKNAKNEFQHFFPHSVIL